MRVTAILLYLAWAAAANADDNCQDSPASFSARVPEAAAATRVQAYLDACREAGGALVKAGDPSMTGRLTPPAEAKVSACYPLHARRRGFEGKAWLGLTVEADGKVSSTRLLATSGHDILDSAAQQCAMRIRFKKAAILDGTPVKVYMEWPFAFFLSQ